MKQINNCMRTHKHHIIPKHAGGTDSPDNLVELSIKEHANAHKSLYDEHGRWQDRVAWLSLSGIMKDEERIYEIQANANKGNPSNWRHSKESKRKLSVANSGKSNGMYGKKAHNRGVKRPGVGGRKKGTVWSTSERIIRERSRSKPGYYDYLKDPERGRKISEATKGRVGPATGKTWYNNGENETYAFICPEGFVKGRKKRESYKKNMLWYNNGNVEKQFKENEQLEGYQRGRLRRK